VIAVAYKENVAHTTLQNIKDQNSQTTQKSLGVLAFPLIINSSEPYLALPRLLVTIHKTDVLLQLWQCKANLVNGVAYVFLSYWANFF
jgi:hypothetical protein